MRGEGTTNREVLIALLSCKYSVLHEQYCQHRINSLGSGKDVCGVHNKGMRTNLLGKSPSPGGPGQLKLVQGRLQGVWTRKLRHQLKF